MSNLAEISAKCVETRESQPLRTIGAFCPVFDNGLSPCRIPGPTDAALQPQRARNNGGLARLGLSVAFRHHLAAQLSGSAVDAARDERQLRLGKFVEGTALKLRDGDLDRKLSYVSAKPGAVQ